MQIITDSCRRSGLSILLRAPSGRSVRCGALAASQNGIEVAKHKEAVEKQITQDYPRLEALYKQIHANPELSLQEEKTSARLESRFV